MARTGMADLITELRGMSEAGTADYTLGTVTYWSDDQLQNILDVNRLDVIYEMLQQVPQVVAGGTLSYTDYRSHYGFFEATTGGTAIFYLQDNTGATIGTADYTPDYRRGQIQFAADQVGAFRYLTGRSYDLDAAAADVWRRKASHYASAFDFSTDNHSVTRSQMYQHAIEMSKHFEGESEQAISSVQMYRADVDEAGDV